MPSIRLPENKGPKKTSRELVVGEGRKITLTTISLTSLQCQSFKQQIAAIAEKLPDGEVVTQDELQRTLSVSRKRVQEVLADTKLFVQIQLGAVRVRCLCNSKTAKAHAA